MYYGENLSSNTEIFVAAIYVLFRDNESDIYMCLPKFRVHLSAVKENSIFDAILLYPAMVLHLPAQSKISNPQKVQENMVSIKTSEKKRGVRVFPKIECILPQ